MVFFPGHVSDPGRALASAGALIKLTRQENPWGRDSMEALAAGVPVVTLGAFDGFIENGVNGYIAQKYAPDEIASYLQQLAGDPGLCHAIGETNKRKGKRLFDAARSARAVEIVYGRVLADTIGHAAVSAGT
jgi:glycosyltransferase involved in cell wall biosynthesis